MGSESPNVILYDSQGEAMAVSNNTAIPSGGTGTSALLFAGSDGTNAHYMLTDGYGRQIMIGAAASGSTVAGNPLYVGGEDPSGNVAPFITDALGAQIVAVGANAAVVQTNATITSSGSTIISTNDFGVQQISLVINITNSPTGTTPTITYTIQEIDPGNNTTTFGNSATSSALNSISINTITLTASTSNTIKVSWTVTGSSASFTGVYTTLVTKVTPTTQAVSGTVAATQSGAWTVTATQATAANLNATVVGTTAAGSGASTGLVTIQGNASGTPVPISGTITANNASVSATGAAVPSSATFVGGEVQALQSGLTTGDLYPLSLTTAGLLRVDGSNVTQPVSGTVTANQGGSWTVQQGTPPWTVQGDAANGAAVAGNPVLIGGSDGTDARTLLTDTSGRQIMVGAAASGAAVTGNPVLVGGVNGTNTYAETLTVAIDRAAMTAGSVTGIPVIGQSSGVGRVSRFDRLGHNLSGNQSLLAFDPIEGSNINTWLWEMIPPADSYSILQVQSFQNSTQSTTTATGTPTLPFTAGNMLEITCYASSASTFSLSATGLTFSAVISSYNNMAIFYAANLPGTQPTITLTIGGSGASAPTFIAAEFSGLKTSSPFISGVQSYSASPTAAVATESSTTDGYLLTFAQFDNLGGLTSGPISTMGTVNPGLSGTGDYQRAEDWQISTGGSITATENGAHGNNIVTITQYAPNPVAVMKIAQSNGILTINSNSMTADGYYAALISNRQFSIMDESPIACSFKANISQTTNSVNEIGFGSPTDDTAIISNGAFFRIENSGNIYAVISSNGSEIVSSSLGTISSSTYYLFYIWIEEGGARFIIESETGIPLVDYFAPLSLSVPAVAYPISHIPIFVRIYTSGTASTAPQTNIVNAAVWRYELDTNKSWSEQLIGTGRDIAFNPLTFSTTIQTSINSAPTAFTPSTTAAGNSYLGGEAVVNMTNASEVLLSIFAFQVPSPYILILEGCTINPPVVTTAFTTTSTVLEFLLMYNSNNGAIAASTGHVIRSLGFYTAAASIAAGTLFTGNIINWNSPAPIACIPNTYVHLAVKVVRGVNTGVYRLSCNFNGYFE
jgi:hypothetical protein